MTKELVGMPSNGRLDVIQLSQNGRLAVIPTDSISGNPDSSRMSRAEKAARSAAWEYRGELSKIGKLKTPSSLKPGSSNINSTKRLTINIAPASRITVSASSEITSRLRKRERLKPTDPRPPSLSDSFRFGLEIWSAGRRPKIRPVSNEMASVTPSR